MFDLIEKIKLQPEFVESFTLDLSLHFNRRLLLPYFSLKIDAHSFIPAIYTSYISPLSLITVVMEKSYYQPLDKTKRTA